LPLIDEIFDDTGEEEGPSPSITIHMYIYIHNDSHRESKTAKIQNAKLLTKWQETMYSGSIEIISPDFFYWTSDICLSMRK